MSDSDVLAQFTVVRLDGDWMDLVCDACSARVSGIESGDSLAALAGTADQHWQDKHDADQRTEQMAEEIVQAAVRWAGGDPKKLREAASILIWTPYLGGR